jgi:hypothetical protein
MKEPRKTTVASWLPVALLTVLAIYLLSFGPACWMLARTHSGERTLEIIYAPLLAVWDHAPITVRDAIYWYAQLGALSEDDSLAIYSVFLRTEQF